MNKTLSLLAVAGTIAFTACNHSEFEGYTKAENGLNYKFYHHDENGVKPKVGDGVGFKYIIRLNSNDSVLVDSKMVVQDGSGILKFILPPSSFVGSLEDALTMMSKGDSASFIISADSFFLKTNKMNELPKYIKTGDKLKVDIMLADLKTKEELEANQKKQEDELKQMASEETGKIEKYISENHITVKPTASGLYYMEIKKGKGALAKEGQLVSVHYTGTLLNGEKFDSSVDRGEPIKIILGQHQVIPGWEETLLLMSKGGKAKVLIPSTIGYGARGMGPITPFSPLVFEMELVNIEDAPPVNSMQDINMQ